MNQIAGIAAGIATPPNPTVFKSPDGWIYDSNLKVISSPDGRKYQYGGAGLPSASELDQVKKLHAALPSNPAAEERLAKLMPALGASKSVPITTQGKAFVRPPAITGMGIAELANQLTNTIAAPMRAAGRALGPSFLPDWMKELPGNMAAGLITSPVDLFADAAVATDPKSTPKQTKKALANLVLKSGLPMGGLSAGFKAVRTAKQLGKDSKAIADDFVNAFNSAAPKAAKVVPGGQNAPAGAMAGMGAKPVGDVLKGFAPKAAPRRGVSDDVQTPGGASKRNVEAKEPAKQPTSTKKGPKLENTSGAEGKTGLANQVQERKEIEGVLSDIPATKGHGAAHWHGEGKKAVDAGEKEFEPNALAQRIANGEEELTGKKVGALLEGARVHENAVNAAGKTLDDAIKSGRGVDEAREAFEKAKADYQAFAENVQQGKGRWSDVGRALQAGTELDTGNFAQVIQAAERSGKVSEKLKKELQEMSGKIGTADEAGVFPEGSLMRQISDLEAENARLVAQGTVEKAKRGPRFSKEAIATERQQIFAEIDEILKSASTGAHDVGSAVYTAVTAGSKLAVAGGRLALNLAKEGVATLDEIVEKVVAEFRNRGLEIDRQTIVDEMAPQGTGATRSEIQKQIDSLRAQAKRESTANKAKIQSDIDELKKQLESGNFRTPSRREVDISKELANLRAEKALYSGKVQSAIKNLAVPVGKKVVREVAGTVRGTILGSDIGILTRQGLFGLSRPVSFAKSIVAGVKATFSEKALVKIQKEILEHDVDGKVAGVVYKKSGLSLTDHLTDPEELIVGRIFKSIPGLKIFAGAGERFQSAFINKLRSDTFDRAIRLGYKENELAARANFINSATGRANVKQVPDWLQVVLTSPRYEKSRWEMLFQPVRNLGLIGKDLAKGKGLNRGAVANIQDMAITAAEVYGLYKLAELSGYEVDFDPISTDFLKMRKGDEVWDPSAGIAPRMRDMCRMVAWSMEPKYNENLLRVMGQAGLDRPISPAVKELAQHASNMIQRWKGVPENEIADLFRGFRLDEDEKGWQTLMPLVFQTVKKYLDEGDVEGAVSAGAREFVGQSVNRYPKPKKK